MKYQVIVGNIGTVYDGGELNKANDSFRVYVSQSKVEGRRASGESVVLMEKGEPIKEYTPQQQKPTLPLTLTGEALNGGAVILTDEQGLAIGLTDEILERGEWRGDLQTVGPWQLPKSYRALCVSTEYEESLGYTKTKALTIHGLRTLTNPRQGGHCLEGTVSIRGGKVRAFTSSQLFEWRGKLIDVATVNACLPGAN